jgi:hypothetical protein
MIATLYIILFFIIVLYILILVIHLLTIKGRILAWLRSYYTRLLATETHKTVSITDKHKPYKRLKN